MPEPEMELRQHWDDRAERSGTRLSGVLFKGLSEAANASLHDWHAWIVRDVFIPRLPARAMVLDLGCGYGRLSRLIAQERPDVRLVGQDLAASYCQRFARTVAPCVLADAARLPFKDGAFDAVLAVTCLMYITRDSLAEAITGIGRLLRSGGLLLSVEPGRELQRLVGAMSPRRSASPTAGRGFSRDEYPRWFERSGFRVLDAGGNPRLSRALLIPGVASSSWSWIRSALASCARRDRVAGGHTRFVLHRWLAAEKRPAA